MIQVSVHSDVPVFRQIIAQLSFLIETGDLKPGQVLPSARMLADNLHINRNTAARAYAELAKLGLVESRGRSGTVVVGPSPAHQGSAAREEARRILESAARQCVDLGLTAAEIQSLAMSVAIRAEDHMLKVSFVECNADRAEYFASALEAAVSIKVKPLVLGEFSPEDEQADLILTTFFHLAQVRNLPRRPGTEVVAIVVAPHVQTLMQIASVPKSRTVGIWYRTDDQAVTVRDWLQDAGLKNLRILHDLEGAELDGIDLVVIPDQQPELKAALEPKVNVIEFGNVLDAASIRMVNEVVRDMQAAKRGDVTVV
ncbi:GntR family transcriptional regulator [Acrocarpospora pleiomorpha]|nr:GntR family transcriptional regulator [Acrocarpospora pleiomorpha]